MDPQIFARDVHSFWQPLDIQFLAQMVKGAHWKKFYFVSPFWTRLLYGGYLDDMETGQAPAVRTAQPDGSHYPTGRRQPASGPARTAGRARPTAG